MMLSKKCYICGEKLGKRDIVVHQCGGENYICMYCVGAGFAIYMNELTVSCEGLITKKGKGKSKKCN